MWLVLLLLTGQVYSVGSLATISMQHGLNDSQRAAVTAKIGAVRVIAGPGSGKTRVLTYRLAHLIQEQHQPPWSILACTFTNKAAGELKSRVAEIVGPEVARKVTVGTFHSICARILRVFGDRLDSFAPGLTGDYTIADANDCRKLIKQILTENKERVELKKVTSRISWLKSRNILPEEFNKMNADDESTMDRENRSTGRPLSRWQRDRQALDATVRQVYPRYQALLRESNAVDFDDLMLLTLQLLRRDEEAMHQIGRKFRHILVDEWQDTNGPQYDLIHLLASTGSRNNKHGVASIFVVGDEDQSIYAFRGADCTNIHKFEEDFDGCRTIMLRENYRSSSNIAHAAGAIMRAAKGRIEKDMVPMKAAGLPIGILQCADSEHEAAVVASAAKGYFESGKLSASEMAVLYRTNAQSRAFEEAFLKTGVPFVVVGSQKFYERKEVKDCIAYLKLLHNPMDAIALKRCINCPPRGIGDKTLGFFMGILEDERKRQSTGLPYVVVHDIPQDVFMAEVEHYFKKNPKAKALPSLLSLIAGNQDLKAMAFECSTRLTKGQINKLNGFAEVIMFHRNLGYTATLPALLESLLKTVKMEDYLAKSSAAIFEESADDRGGAGKSSDDRWNNVIELQRAVERLPNTPALEGTLEQFLCDVMLMTDGDDEGFRSKEVNTKGTVKLMTVHASKGLEYDCVFFAGLEQGTLPLSSVPVEEERRIMFVGMTRAKHRLFISWREHVMRIGRDGLRLEDGIPSEFLHAVPREFVKRINKTSNLAASVSKPAQRRIPYVAKSRGGQFRSGLGEYKTQRRDRVNSNTLKPPATAFPIPSGLEVGVLITHPMHGEGRVIGHVSEAETEPTVKVEFGGSDGYTLLLPAFSSNLSWSSR
ncbi:unnamed protein product [Chrysoparadoxa australica]